MQKDKKGGGISILYKKNEDIEVEEITSIHPDIFVGKVKIGNYNFKVIVTYISTNDFNRNNVIYNEIQNHIESFDINDNILILGDFNGHLGFLGPQKINKNGKKLLDLSEKYNLSIINLDTNCLGEITWQQGNMKSAIDFALCNQRMLNNLIEMIIDEEWEILKISDHNLINLTFKYDSLNNYNNSKNIITYNKKSDVAIHKYLTDIVINIKKDNNDIDMNKLNNIIIDSQNVNLKTTIIKKPNKKGKIDAPWYNKYIDKAIAKRREINKNRRKAQDPILQNTLKCDYELQKNNVQILVIQAIEKYEIDLTNKILNDKNRGKKIYNHINTLKNMEINPKRDCNVYTSNDDIILDKDEIKNEFKIFWEPIYQQHENEIINKWNNDSKTKYNDIFMNNNRSVGKYISGVDIENGIFKYRYDTINFPKCLQEHYEYAMPVEKHIHSMNDPLVTKIQVINQIKKLKEGKAPGPDSIKPELFKYLNMNDEIITKLTSIYNEIIQAGKVPDEWKQSRTILINKNSKPKANEFRPIALTNISYKILMGI